MNKTAIVTVANYQHLPGAECLFASIDQHNQNLPAHDRFIITGEHEDITSSPVANIHIVAKETYRGVIAEIQGMHPSFWKLEVFNPAAPFAGYDRVIYLDADILVIGDISSLFGCDAADIYGCPTQWTGYYPRTKPIAGGMFIVNRSGMTYPDALDVMLRMNRVEHFTQYHEQQILNRFRDQSAMTTGYLDPDEYLVLKRWYGHSRWDEHADKHKVIHFVDGKPWLEDSVRQRAVLSNCGRCQKPDQWYTHPDLMKLWHDHYKEAQKAA